MPGEDIIGDLIRLAPDVAIDVLLRRTWDTACRHLDQLCGNLPPKNLTKLNWPDGVYERLPRSGRDILQQLLESGGVMAGSFPLSCFYGDAKFGDIDIWVEYKPAMRGDPRKVLFPADHPDRNLDWFGGAARLALLTGWFPMPTPYQYGVPRDGPRLERIHHSILPAAHRATHNHSGVYTALKPTIDSDQIVLDTFDSMSKYMESCPNTCHYRCWSGSRIFDHETDDAKGNSFSAEDLPPTCILDAIETCGRTKNNVGIVDTFNFTTRGSDIKIQIHFVDLSKFNYNCDPERKLQHHLYSIFDFDLPGCVQIDKNGVNLINRKETFQRLLTRTLKINSYPNFQLTPAAEFRLRTIAECLDKLLARFGDNIDYEMGKEFNFQSYHKCTEYPTFILWLREVMNLIKLRHITTTTALLKAISHTKVYRLDKYTQRGFRFERSAQFKDQLCKEVPFDSSMALWERIRSGIANQLETLFKMNNEPEYVHVMRCLRIIFVDATNDDWSDERQHNYEEFEPIRMMNKNNF